jgi:hypothetical protein
MQSGNRETGSRKKPCKPERNQSDAHANDTLLAAGLHPSHTLVKRWLAAAGAGWEGAEHGRKQEAYANIAACLINRAPHRMATTGFPDELKGAGSRLRLQPVERCLGGSGMLGFDGLSDLLHGNLGFGAHAGIVESNFGQRVEFPCRSRKTPFGHAA